MSTTVKVVFMSVGGAIALIAILDMMNVPLEIPTPNNYANLAIGGALVIVPFIFPKL